MASSRTAAVESAPRGTIVRSATAISLIIAVTHGVNDVYAAFLAPLLPRIMDKLGLTVALAATLAMTLSIAASVVQPLAGYLADRYGRRLFVALGPILSAIFLSAMGLAPSFAVLIVLLCLGGLGSAVFHPPAAAIAARAQEGKGSGLRLSVFSFGGAMGFAVGPLVAVAIVSRVGLEGLWIAMVPGILVGIAAFLLLPGGAPNRPAVRPPAPSAVIRSLRGPLGIVFIISALGAFIQRVFLTMEPIVAADAGASEATGAIVLSVYLAAQGAGTLTSGWLTDRVDRRRLLVALTIVAFPAHTLAIWLPPGGAGAVAAAMASGFVNMAILPPVVIMAQEMIPDGAAVGSGVAMGLAWALGSVGVLGTGLVGDWVGARDAALVSFPLILAGSALALHPSLRPFGRPKAHRDVPIPDRI